jgi:hypothetical protein
MALRVIEGIYEEQTKYAFGDNVSREDEIKKVAFQVINHSVWDKKC